MNANLKSADDLVANGVGNMGPAFVGSGSIAFAAEAVLVEGADLNSAREGMASAVLKGFCDHGWGQDGLVFTLSNSGSGVAATGMIRRPQRQKDIAVALRDVSLLAASAVGAPVECRSWLVAEELNADRALEFARACRPGDERGDSFVFVLETDPAPNVGAHMPQLDGPNGA